MSGVQSCRGTISRPVQSRQSSIVRPTCLSLGLAGSHLTWILNLWWYLVTRYRCLTCGPYPLGGARSRGVHEG